jgi:hypothetical protein
LSDELYYPGNGYPPNPGEDRPGLSAFGRLAKGQPLGKSSTFVYRASDSNDPQFSGQDLLRISGDDVDACQMTITLVPPRVQVEAFADIPIDVETSPQSTITNSEASSDDFPGEAAPLTWPPLEAVIEWGVKGAQARAVVDYVNGVVINVTASFVNVRAMVSQGSDVDVEGTSAAYLVSAFIGPGWAQQTNARRTVFLGSVAATTESAVFAVPKFASRVLVVSRDNGAVPTLLAAFIRFWQSPDGQPGGACVGSFYQTGNQPDVFEVPNGAAYFSVYNQGTATPIAVIFELAMS